MASDQQVALARTHHRLPPTGSSHVSKQTRQIVPAFLQKLYEMVNDPNNADLIRWSDAGESFFVLDHERFAREVLGRWFKHQNFSSFVRQLNMYGFHKIPHLQQGVLRSDSDTEFWNFAHANFHRGQPDLLCLIQRKKQSSQQQMQIQQQAEEAAAAGLITDVGGNSIMGVPGTVPSINGASGPGLINATAGALGTSGSGLSGLTTLNNSQLLDIHSIVQGITAIKRHQTTISAELVELKRSNELLWQDALLAREKHQKQEDTINRIVKFLAGVFGKHAAPGAGGVATENHHGGGHHEGGDPPRTNVSMQRGGDEAGRQQGMHQRGGVVTRRRARLMIEDGRRQSQSVPTPDSNSSVNAVGVTEESDEEVVMNDSTAGVSMGNRADPSNANAGSGVQSGGGRDPPPSPLTISEYRSPSPRLSLDKPGTGDDTITTSPFFALDLNDSPDMTNGTRKVRDGLDYPTIEMEMGTPKSVNTPLPEGAQKETAPTPQTLAALNQERALMHTPPVFHPQQGNGQNSAPGDNAPFSFDHRNLMVNLTPAQIQQLLTTLASQTLPEPIDGPGGSMGLHGEHYESRFLTNVNGDGSNREDGSRGQFSINNQHPQLQYPPTPQFDISGYLVPSPQLASLSLGNMNPGSDNTSSNTAPASGPSCTTTKTNNNNLALQGSGGGKDGHHSDATASGKHVPVPDGLITFDSSEAINAAPPADATSSSTPGADSASYEGDLSVSMPSQAPFVIPWMPYQGIGGYSQNPGSANAGSNGAYGGVVPGYDFFNASAGGWGNVGTGNGVNGATNGDFNNGFSPILQGQRNGYGAGSGTSNSTTSGGSPATDKGRTQNQHDTNANNAGLQDHHPSLGSIWQGAEDIDRDVNAMNTTIHNLIQALGLDPTSMDRPSSHGMGDGDGSSGTGGIVDGDGTDTGTGTDGSGADFESFLSTWEAPAVGNGSVGGGGGGGTGKKGAAVTPPDSSRITTLPSETATTTSTPSAASVAGSVLGEGPDGLDLDNIDEDTEVIGDVQNPPLALPRTSGLGRKLPSSRVLQQQRQRVSNVSDDTVGPINKKVRTSLTASIPTSAGVPTTVEPVGPGGKRRRSAIVADGGGDVGGELDEGAGQEHDSGAQVQTRSAVAAASGKVGGAKSKKRRG
ncbi:hypothetical protein AX15_000850 [Amanita polypyramis BW_CC]|nr:hypothetical protein AX15_000850 [Amanita polypyramis BW_CC]